MRNPASSFVTPSPSPSVGSCTVGVLSFFLLFAVEACAPKRPALYPNQQSELISSGQVRDDIDRCIAEAKAAGYDRSSTRDAAVGTTTGAAAGAAIGAATGAIHGHAGRGAAGGAVGGAVGGLLRSIFRSRDPDPIEKQYVETCLREKGYQPIGWK